MNNLAKSQKLAYKEFNNFAVLTQEETGLPIDIFLDQCMSYRKFKHPLWIYIRNGYCQEWKFIPITVEDKRVLANGIKLNIYNRDIVEAIRFIINHEQDIIDIVHERMDVLDLYYKIIEVRNPQVYKSLIKNGTDLKQMPFRICGQTIIGYTKIKNQQGKYNFINYNIEIIYNDGWFDTAYDFRKNVDGTIRAYTVLNDLEGYLYDNPIRWIQVQK